MNNRQWIRKGAVAISAVLFLGSPLAQSAEVYLSAQSFTKTIPHGDGGSTLVTMWGYATCSGTGGVVDLGSCAAPTSPGTPIVVAAGDPTLTVYLQNSLAEATSIMIAGQANAPLTDPNSVRNARGALTSFVPVVAPTETGTYSWTLDPGAYLYQSGTHVQLQVQMGLYGAVVHDTTGCGGTNCAYDDVAYDASQVLVFSEVDPALHDPAPTAANATVGGYVPTFFLINGEPYTTAAPGDLAATTGQSTLLRLINAGLDNRVPVLLGDYFEVIAQDGHRAPVSRSQYSALLPAAKSLDVMFTPAVAGTYTLFDRRNTLVNGPVGGGGMLRKIVVSP